MPRHPGLSQWHQTVSIYLSYLSQPQVTVVVLWSIGIVLLQSCGLTTVAVMLAYLLDFYTVITRNYKKPQGDIKHSSLTRVLHPDTANSLNSLAYQPMKHNA